MANDDVEMVVTDETIDRIATGVAERVEDRLRERRDEREWAAIAVPEPSKAPKETEAGPAADGHEELPPDAPESPRGPGHPTRGPREIERGAEAESRTTAAERRPRRIVPDENGYYFAKE